MAPRKLSLLQTLRENAFHQLTAIFTDISSPNIPVEEARALGETARECEARLQELEDEIEEANAKSDPDNGLPTRAVADAVRAIKIKIRVALANREASLVHPLSTPALPQGFLTASMNPLPAFSGNLSEWPRFISLFDSLIHNNPSLDLACKFQHLSLALAGEAASVIADLEMRPFNYLIAYEALRRRYHCPRRMGGIYLNRIRDFRPLMHPSATQLQKYLDVHQTTVCALRALPLGDLSDFMLFTAALDNLDSATRDAFEEAQSENNIPLHHQLMAFVTRRLRAIQLRERSPSLEPPRFPVRRSSPCSEPRRSVSPRAAQNSRSSRSPRPSSRTPSSRSPPSALLEAPSSQPSCHYCSSPLHVLRQCPAFKRLRTNARLQIILDQHGCVNCLSHGHQIANCKSKGRCRVCGAPHHTLLHIPRTNTPRSQASSAKTSSQCDPSSAKTSLGLVNNSSPAADTSHLSRGVSQRLSISSTNSSEQ